MRRKSDFARGRRISATEANRTFSHILDDVEAGGRFLVHRHGRDVCLLAPPPTESRLASACRAVLRAHARVRLDDRFGRDLLEVIESERAEARPAWDS